MCNIDLLPCHSFNEAAIFDLVRSMLCGKSILVPMQVLVQASTSTGPSSLKSCKEQPGKYLHDMNDVILYLIFLLR
jgi:hypothetical protein